MDDTNEKPETVEPEWIPLASDLVSPVEAVADSLPPDAEPVPEVGDPAPEPDQPDLDQSVPFVEPETPTETLPVAVLAAIESIRDAVLGRLGGLEARFDREIRAEATREKVVDRLHAELQEYKQGMLLGVLRPVFVDLIQLHDDIGKMIDGRPGETPEEGSAPWVDRLASVRQGVEDILWRQGVERFQVEDDDTFDPRRQRAVSTVPNDDPALSRTVAARLKPGFRSGDKVIRPEIVSVRATPPRRD